MRTNVLRALLAALSLAACSGGATSDSHETLESSEAGMSSEPLLGDASNALAMNDSGEPGQSVGAVTDAAPVPREASACTDSCPASGAGVTLGCEKRFLTGVNYAWKNWAADFGGSKAWSESGVSGNQAAIKSDLADMQSHGVDVVRWWMLQQLASDAVTFDASGKPTGAVGGTLVADIQAALALAAETGVHYNFTLFSFDDFAASGNDNGATLHGMAPIITDPTQRAALMNVIKTIAQTVEQSPNKDRVVSWDIINEPEWVISDTDTYGDPAFAPNTKYQAVTFAQMQTFVSDVATTLHANSSALVTVGSAAIKWAHAFSHVGLDYYTFHMYDWVNQYYPYDEPPSTYGVTDKPAVMGEFPLDGLAAVNNEPAVPLSTMLSTLMSIGYAGAMPWAVDDTCCGSWTTEKPDLEAFSKAHACVTKF
jgi:hypothetical protein